MEKILYLRGKHYKNITKIVEKDMYVFSESSEKRESSSQTARKVNILSSQVCLSIFQLANPKGIFSVWREYPDLNRATGRRHPSIWSV